MDRETRRKIEEAASTLRAVRSDDTRVSSDVCQALALERVEQLLREALASKPSPPSAKAA